MFAPRQRPKPRTRVLVADRRTVPRLKHFGVKLAAVQDTEARASGSPVEVPTPSRGTLQRRRQTWYCRRPRRCAPCRALCRAPLWDTHAGACAVRPFGTRMLVPNRPADVQ